MKNAKANAKLITPTLEFKDEFLAMVTEHLKFDENPKVWDFHEAAEDFEAYVKKLTDYARGENLPAGWVAATKSWLVDVDNVVIGASGLRHKLTANLRTYGGHIGYYIRPTKRRQGYGELICRLTIEKAKEMGLRRILITCDDNNTASAKIIENCGGVLNDKVLNEGRSIETRRYWIKLQIDYL